jgi:hypothetical protein
VHKILFQAPFCKKRVNRYSKGLFVSSLEWAKNGIIGVALVKTIGG